MHYATAICYSCLVRKLHRPSKTGKLLCACSNASSFFGSHFFLGLVPLLFLLFDRVLLSAHLLMLTFSSKGKAYLNQLGGKAREKKISSLPGESPSHSPLTLCLDSHLLPVSPCTFAFFCSSPFRISFTLPLFSSLLPSICAWRY